MLEHDLDQTPRNSVLSAQSANPSSYDLLNGVYV